MRSLRQGQKENSMTTLDFNLVQIIKDAWGDPLSVVDMVWDAGYQKTDFTIEEIIEMAVRRGAECEYYNFPSDSRPTTIEDLSKWELADIIDEAMWVGTPAEVAAEILMNGYRKGGAE